MSLFEGKMSEKCSFVLYPAEIYPFSALLANNMRSDIFLVHNGNEWFYKVTFPLEKKKMCTFAGCFSQQESSGVRFFFRVHAMGYSCPWGLIIISSLEALCKCAGEPDLHARSHLNFLSSSVTA